MSVEEKFAVSLGSEDWRVDDFGGFSSHFGDTGSDTIDGKLMCGGVPDDAAFADVLASGLKLRLDENNHFERRSPGTKGVDDGRQDEGSGDEGDVHGKEGNARGKISGVQIAGVGALHEGHTGVAPQGVGNLSVTGVDGEDAGGSVLEHAVGEASGRRSDIETESAGEVDIPVIQRGFEFEAAAADVAEILAKQAQRCGFRDAVAGFVDFLLVNQNTTGEDDGLSTLASRGKSPLYEQLIEPQLHLRAPFCGIAIELKLIRPAAYRHHRIPLDLRACPTTHPIQMSRLRVLLTEPRRV